MGVKYLFLFFVVVYSLSFVNAADLGYSNPTLPKLTSTTPVTVTGSVNYSTVNTNNSQYLEGINSSGFWQTGGNNQNVGAGTKTGSYNINTTGNISVGHTLMNGSFNLRGLPGNNGSVGSSTSLRTGAGGSSTTANGGFGGTLSIYSGTGGGSTKTTGGTGAGGGAMTMIGGSGGNSVATSGTATSGGGSNFDLQSGNGGTSRSASTGRAVGGNGGYSYQIAGSGGSAEGSGSDSLGNIGGNGGTIHTYAGSGGGAYTSRKNIGGNGGDIVIDAGDGGNGNGGTSSYGGNGGIIQILLGRKGYGDTAQGIPGDLIFYDGEAIVIGLINGTTNDFKWLNEMWLINSKKLYFGTTKESSIVYNGTDLLINPKETGTGNVYVQGQLDSTNYSIQGKIGLTRSFNMTNGSLNNCWMNFTGGILTSSNC